MGEAMSTKSIMSFLNFLRPGNQAKHCRTENVAGDWAEVREAVLHSPILKPRIPYSVCTLRAPCICQK
jgi:hypothetical protein